MDDSWRMRMGMPPSSRTPRRGGASQLASSPSFDRRRSSLSESLDPDDFADVFGGPPQTVLLRKFSGDFLFTSSTASPTSFYDEVFRPQEHAPAATRSGRSLLAFRIPETADAFYGDIFGSDGDRKSRDRTRPGSNAKSKAKSRSNSSSVLSSEDSSPLRPAAIGEDVALSSYASKLRPINVPSRWNTSRVKPEDHQKNRVASPFPSAQASPVETLYSETENRQHSRSPFNGFSRRVTSPETISIDPSSYRSVKISSDDIEVNTPAASEVSSLDHQDHESRQNNEDNSFMVEEEGVEGYEEDDDISSSFVIEIGSKYREPIGETEGIDDAIAWAKERFNAHMDRKDSSLKQQGTEDKAAEEKGRPNNTKHFHEITGSHHKMNLSEMEMEQVDEEIRLWSAGKENNIRLLLSTLHQVLWSKSGWSTLPITSLVETSHVKKAYQKARLCLHPDKLQQRGASSQEKYIAEKAFSILQDAWTAFTSQEALFG